MMGWDAYIALRAIIWHVFDTRQQPAEWEARRRTSMSVIDRQISDWSDPRFEIDQMSQNGPFLEPLNMTLKGKVGPDIYMAVAKSENRL